jgi:hypothetical protein
LRVERQNLATILDGNCGLHSASSSQVELIAATNPCTVPGSGGAVVNVA